MTSAALVWAPTRTTVVTPPQPPEIPLVGGDRGPDVASYQGYPNWDMVVASGCRFAFTKATEGTFYVNPYFDNNWVDIQRVGLVRGTYHFARPNDSSAQAECDYFLSHVHLTGEHDMLVLDLEDGNGNLHDWCMQWLLRCYSFTGRKPLLYTGAYFMQEHGLCESDIAAATSGLWLAAYSETCPPVPAGWPEITFWQYTDKESIPGIQGGVDCNIYRP